MMHFISKDLQIMLTNGDGVEADNAVRYMKNSSDNGNYDAMYYYAKMLYEGDGVEVNKKEASRYFKMSVDKGNKKGKEKVGKDDHFLDFLLVGLLTGLFFYFDK